MQRTSLPIAVGESLYSLSQFREYLEHGACSLLHVDARASAELPARIKVAHLSESFNVKVCPHFLMELHVSLCAAVPSASWVEYIPRAHSITRSRIDIDDGFANPPDTSGLGIKWDWHQIEKRALQHLKIK